MLAKRVNLRSLRALGWPIPKTALTAGIIAAKTEGADAWVVTCECGTNATTVIYTILLAAALAATAYYLGRRSAQAGLYTHASGRGFAGESPGKEEAKQGEEIYESPLPVGASDDEDEATMRRSEDGYKSWSVFDGPRTPSRAATRPVLIQGPVTYLRKREQPRYQPLRDGLRGALATAESRGDG